MNKVKTVKCFNEYWSNGGCDTEYRISIKSKLSERFIFSVRADELQSQISFFKYVDGDIRCFEGRNKRELLKHYEEMLREEAGVFNEMSEVDLQKCRDFNDFCNDVISYEALKLAVSKKPISLLMMRIETPNMKN